jgi:hypothetical protein
MTPGASASVIVAAKASQAQPPPRTPARWLRRWAHVTLPRCAPLAGSWRSDPLQLPLWTTLNKAFRG